MTTEKLRAVLIRQPSTDQGTFGRFFFQGNIWHSLELPWRDNQRGVSCFPVGEYEARLTHSPRFKKSLYELFGVPGRGQCRIHPANLAGDRLLGYSAQLEGCIALGKARGAMILDNGKRQNAVLISQPAVREFMTLAQGRPFILEVKDA